MTKDERLAWEVVQQCSYEFSLVEELRPNVWRVVIDGTAYVDEKHAKAFEAVVESEGAAPK